MSSNLPWVKFWVRDWIIDTQTMSQNQKACWFDLLCQMWVNGASELIMDYESLAALWKFPALEEAQEMITSLAMKRVCDVEFPDSKETSVDCNEDVRIICRRLVKEEIDRKLNAKYQQDHREKRLVRKMSGKSKLLESEVRSQKSENIPPPPPLGASSPPFKMPEKRNGFLKPQPDEITAYAKTIGFILDGQQFFDYYEARGWQFKNGQPMKSWKAAVSTWKRNGFSTGGFNVGTNRPASHVKLNGTPERAKEYAD